MITMKKLILISSLLVLTACVDKTGLSEASSKSINPKSNADAVVQVLEYGDFQCPACRSAYTYVVQPLLEKYGSQIRFEFRQFPLTSVHEYAMLAAEASECAADQGKFWEFVDTDYTHQDQLSRASIEEWGTQLKLDMTLFDRCQKSHIKRKAILAEYNQGIKLGVGGTPTFMVNGKIVESTLDALGAAIDEVAGSVGAKL